MFDEATLWKLLDRELPPTEAARIEAAARTDPALAERIAHLRAIKDGVLGDAPTPSADFAARVEARAREGTPFQVLAEPPRRSQTWLKVAAVLLIGLGITNLYVSLRPLRADPPPDLVQQRLDDYKNALSDAPLTALQTRQIRAALVRHDKEDELIRQPTANQLRDILALEKRSREKIRAVLSNEQRAILDRDKADNRK